MFPRKQKRYLGPWGPDGALLCNYPATTFKLFFLHVGGLLNVLVRLFTYAVPDLEACLSGFSIITIGFADEQSCGCDYDHGIAFKRVTWLRIFESSEEERAHRQERDE